MAKHNGKKPKARGFSPASNTPKAVQPSGPATTQQVQPIFCFKHAQRNGDARWAFNPTADDAPGLFGFLCDTAQKTWAEIEKELTGGKQSHRKHHDQPVDSIEPDAIKDFNKARLADVFGDQPIFRFRLGGEKRLWGFRNGHIFHVVWWDPNHKIYETDK